MKIAIVTSAFPPDGAHSGNAPFFFELAKALVDSGHRVCVATFTQAKSRVEVIDGIEIYRVHFNPALYKSSHSLAGLPTVATFLPQALNLFRHLKEIIDEFSPDVIECVDNGFEGLFWALDRSYPLVIRSLCPQFHLMRQASQAALPEDEKLVRTLETLALKNATAITTTSLSMAGIISEASQIPIAEMSIVQNPLNIPKAANGRYLQAEDDLEYREGKQLNLVFVGRVEKLKGCDILIEALPLIHKEYPEVKLKLIGSYPESAEEPGQFIHALRSRLSHFRLGQSCHFVGALSRHELQAHTMAADICVYPSRYDSSPYACLEAMSHGAAVVASRIGGIPEYVEDGVSGLLFEMGNHKDLAETVIKLARDHALRKSIRKAAVNRVKNLCQPSETARKSIAVYEQARERFFNKHAANSAVTPIADETRATVNNLLKRFDLWNS